MKTLREKLATAEIIKINEIVTIKSGSELFMSFQNETQVDSFLNEDPTALFEKLNVKILRPCTEDFFASCIKAMEPNPFLDAVEASAKYLAKIKNKSVMALMKERSFFGDVPSHEHLVLN
jgi:hypothetical protein